MYSGFQLAKKYTDFFLHASNSKGHGVHSPFVYDFVVHVLNGHNDAAQFQHIEKYRRQLLKDGRMISVEDFGAGGESSKMRQRKLSAIAASDAKNKKFSRLLFRIANYYGCKTIVELGTSLGISTAYLSSSSPDCRVTTFEGAGRVADIAEDFFESTGQKNISLIRGDFNETLSPYLETTEKIDLLFMDGNHREEPTITYFDLCLNKAHNKSIFILDDIRWSAEMERAWQRVKSHPAVTLSIDLFFLGLVFFEKEFLVKQDFSIRF